MLSPTTTDRQPGFARLTRAHRHRCTYAPSRSPPFRCRSPSIVAHGAPPTPTESIHPRNHLRHFADQINVGPLLPADASLFQRANQISFPSVFHPIQLFPTYRHRTLDFLPPGKVFRQKFITERTDFPPIISHSSHLRDNLLRDPSIRGSIVSLRLMFSKVYTRPMNYNRKNFQRNFSFAKCIVNFFKSGIVEKLGERSTGSILKRIRKLCNRGK